MCEIRGEVGGLFVGRKGKNFKFDQSFDRGSRRFEKVSNSNGLEKSFGPFEN